MPHNLYNSRAGARHLYKTTLPAAGHGSRPLDQRLLWRASGVAFPASPMQASLSLRLYLHTISSEQERHEAAYFWRELRKPSWAWANIDALLRAAACPHYHARHNNATPWLPPPAAIYSDPHTSSSPAGTARHAYSLPLRRM